MRRNIEPHTSNVDVFGVFANSKPGYIGFWVVNGRDNTNYFVHYVIRLEESPFSLVGFVVQC